MDSDAWMDFEFIDRKRNHCIIHSPIHMRGLHFHRHRPRPMLLPMNQPGTSPQVAIFSRPTPLLCSCGCEPKPTQAGITCIFVVQPCQPRGVIRTGGHIDSTILGHAGNRLGSSCWVIIELSMATIDSVKTMVNLKLLWALLALMFGVTLRSQKIRPTMP